MESREITRRYPFAQGAIIGFILCTIAAILALIVGGLARLFGWVE
ncbi:hypothetical protein M527_00225 [Sphingobium indicum IP26]|uniref:Uncharacterized protein n=1 Tax=Sphingobium quisquiliarum P25 TaxID=1329909 RepID=T0GVD4_9SPHN|nr:hypothetical protein [Sphingobium quisquiliarum]EPR15699.1 hypothetical protein M527_00225 [Sphingobium indicum IP26]EQB04652.1 hypothetical protein L288_13400 [Sphingobium quisquiliarum P25]